MNPRIPIPEQETAASIEKILSSWKKKAFRLQLVFISTGILVIACLICIILFNEQMGSYITKILAGFIILFLAIISLYNLQTKAKNVRNGWRYLNKAMYSYKSQKIKIDALIDAWEEGEKILRNKEIKIFGIVLQQG